MYKNLVKPLLFLMSPDFVHTMIVRLGKLAQVVAPVRWLLGLFWRKHDDRLQQSLLGIDFANPVGLSAGFDKNIELTPLMESVGFGFETGGSVTLSERKGNERPWFFRLPKTESIVVHAGLANKGIVNIAPGIKKNSRKVKQTPLFISVAVVAKNPKETNQDAIIDARSTVDYILQRGLAQAIEINISCPNAGDCQPFSGPELLDELLVALDTLERNVPFFVKMPVCSTAREFDALLGVIVRHNIQGVTISNLVKDRKLVKLKDELPEDIKGGLSGAPVRAISTALITRAYSKYGDRLTIIGVGGIFSAEHAYEKIRAGASLVAMITGVIFEGPQVVGRINRELLSLMAADGFGSISEAVGADHRKKKDFSKKAL